MPRRPRLVVPGLPLHVIQRGNNRVATFRSAADFARFLDIAVDASRSTGIAVHAYVLMTNHVHLLLTPREERSPARFMQRIGRRYVRYFNTRYDRTGTLWESRYRSSVVDSERYLLACARYIERNPVRAGLADSPGEYRWSSFRHNAHGIPDRLVIPHEAFLQFGRSGAERRSAYRALFAHELSPETLVRIRASVQRGDPIGRDESLRDLGVEVARSVD